MVELEDFKYGGTNISALRMVNPSDENVLQVVQDWVKGEMRFNRKIPFAGKTIRVSSYDFLPTDTQCCKIVNLLYLKNHKNSVHF